MKPAARDRGHALDNVNWDDPLDYVRKRYNVPAEKGRAVRLYNGDVGIIEGADNGLLLVKMPLDGQIVRVHPTWEIDYDAECSLMDSSPVVQGRAAFIAQGHASYVLDWLRQTEAPDNIIRLQEAVVEQLGGYLGAVARQVPRV